MVAGTAVSEVTDDEAPNIAVVVVAAWDVSSDVIGWAVVGVVRVVVGVVAAWDVSSDVIGWAVVGVVRVVVGIVVVVDMTEAVVSAAVVVVVVVIVVVAETVDSAINNAVVPKNVKGRDSIVDAVLEFEFERNVIVDNVAIAADVVDVTGSVVGSKVVGTGAVTMIVVSN